MFCIEITEGALIYNMVHYVDFVRNVIIEINNVIMKIKWRERSR